MVIYFLLIQNWYRQVQSIRYCARVIRTGANYAQDANVSNYWNNIFNLWQGFVRVIPYVTISEDGT